MTKKQYRKADSMVFPVALVVMIGILLNVAGLYFSSDNSVKYLITTIVCLAGIIGNTVVYCIGRGKPWCGWILTLVAALTYDVMVLCVDIVFFYVLVAAILVIDMAYLEVKRIIITAVLTLPVLIGKTALLCVNNVVTPTEAGTTLVIMLFVLVSVIFITRIWIVFNKENITIVHDGAQVQKEVTDRMMHVSENIIQQFDEANEHVQELSEALDTGHFSMKNIAANAESTAHAIQEQTQMCQAIQVNAQNAKERTDEMVQASNQALENVSLGATAMEELHSHAMVVATDNKETVERVASLNERASQVADILNTIVKISAQTNLLALNASIEAARAGEAGKGFAVVADQIRTLSEQTKEATENITTILTDLNNDVESVTASINHSVEAVDQQNQLIEDTKSQFDAISGGVNELMDVIGNFQQVITDIAESAGVIADGITGLSANSEEVAATSGEGMQLMEQAVIDMGNVNESLTNIYNLAQDLQKE